MNQPLNISWGSAFRGPKHLLTRYDWRMAGMSREGAMWKIPHSSSDLVGLGLRDPYIFEIWFINNMYYI